MTNLPPIVEAIARSIRNRLPADEAEAFDAAVAAAAAGRDLARAHTQFITAEMGALLSQPDDVQALYSRLINDLHHLRLGEVLGVKLSESAIAWHTHALLAMVDSTAARAAANAARDAMVRRQRDLLLQLLADQERIDA